jgi:predicted lipid-binding transport protein (Tim44 family)
MHGAGEDPGGAREHRRGRRASPGTWQQPVMTLGGLLILAAVLLPLAGALMRVRLDEQAKAAHDEFRKAVVAATESHGVLLATLGGENVEYATEALARMANEQPRVTMVRYARLHAGYAEWMAAQGRSDLQPKLDEAKQAYRRAQKAYEHAQDLGRRHETVLGQYLRYAGFAGSTGFVLVLWTALTGLGRHKRL